MTDTTDIKALRTLSMQRVKEIANGDSMLMGERVDLANTAIRFHKELDVALDAFKNAAIELFSAQEQLEAERQRAEALQGKDHGTGFDSIKNLKFVADCCIENQDSIYASEFFLLLDEMFGKQGDYLMPVQAVAVSHLIVLLEAERQQREAAEKDREGLQKALVIYGDEILELRSKLVNPVVLPERKKAEFYVDEEFSNKDLAAIYNCAILELKKKIHSAGFTTVKDGQ